MNKIDPEARQRVKETTSTNKVHNKREIFINRDNKDGKRNNQGNFGAELSKYKNGKSKKKILVQATKVEEVKVNAFKEEGENVSRADKRGTILDVKK